MRHTRALGLRGFGQLGMEARGLDSDGRQYKNADEMWREEIGGEEGNDVKKIEWYRKGVGYWEVSTRSTLSSHFFLSAIVATTASSRFGDSLFAILLLFSS